MHIFLDESGTFALPAPGTFSPSIVGALVVPDFKLAKLEQRYARLRHRLPKDAGEVKGRLLNEAQVAQVVDLLRRNSGLFFAHVIETGLEDKDLIRLHREGAAEAMTKHLTDRHFDSLKADVWARRRQLEEMSVPLYLQYALMSELLTDVLRTATLYWAQRRMPEIISFRWMVDGKSPDGQTKAEEWWDIVKGASVQSKLAREPLIALEGLDYSAFDEKFRGPTPQYLRETIVPHDQSFSLNLMLDEHFTFSSGNDFGLELVDILTNATRRALKGNLSEAGWRGIPGLMVHGRGEYLKMRTLRPMPAKENVPYSSLLVKNFATGGRSMLVRG